MANNNPLTGSGLFLNKSSIILPLNKNNLILRATTQCLLKTSQTLNPKNIDDALNGDIEFSSNGSGSIVPNFGFPPTGLYSVFYSISQSLQYVNYFARAVQDSNGFWVSGGYRFLQAMFSSKTVNTGGKSNIKFNKTKKKQTVLILGTAPEKPGYPDRISIGTIKTVGLFKEVYADTLRVASLSPGSVTYDINSGTNSEMLVVLNYNETVTA